MPLGAVCVTAGLTGLLSFVFLTVAIATDYWYIIDVSDSGSNYGEGWEDLNSHSGLWRICEVSNREQVQMVQGRNEFQLTLPRLVAVIHLSLAVTQSARIVISDHCLLTLCGKNACIALIDPFGEESQNVPESQQHLLFMQKVFVILLPLSLVLLVLGGIGGLISSLANGLCLLLFTGSYFLVGGALTLAGICVYVAYSKAAFAIAKHIYGDKVFDNVRIGFSWSMVLACLSCVLEVMSGALFLLAAKLTAMEQPEQSAVI
ncbi:transmembrane protein 235-like [Pristis pectinata]|uniref:transmembrane protein 235-like n=1 Tax=Pristis pectinata TaxID=685728 RepID=UPI00223E095D|nr:transmembrane protein 235-like [Pristis pectinata]